MSWRQIFEEGLDIVECDILCARLQLGVGQVRCRVTKFVFFVPIGLLLKIRSGPKEGTFWAPNYLSKLLHFNLNNTFQNMAGSLSFKSGLMLMFWTFKLSFDVDILAFFNLVTCFGYLFKLGYFF
jgi:hypothetical protein